MVSQISVVRVTEKPTVKLVRSEMNRRGTTFPQIFLSALKLFVDRSGAILRDRRERARTRRSHLVSSAIGRYRSPSDRAEDQNKNAEYEDTTPPATGRRA